MQLESLGAANLPAVVGRYTLLAILGEGGMARVFRATMDGAMGFKKPAAVKVVLRASGEKAELLRQQLVQEARLGGLLNHPNVVQTFDCGELEGFPYIAMELVEGLGLSDLVERVGPLPAAAVLDVAIQAARGLHHAHTATSDGHPLHIIHRDVKPSNILIRRDGVVKVMDFGIAKVQMTDALATESGMMKGTPSYMSPEQLAGKPLDGRSDLFALGAVIFHMITGRTLFTGGSITEVMMRIIQVDDWVRAQNVETLADACVPGLGNVLIGVLAQRSVDRPDDAQALAERLEQLRQHFPLESPLPRLMDRALPRPSPGQGPTSRADTVGLGETAVAPFTATRSASTPPRSLNAPIVPSVGLAEAPVGEGNPGPSRAMLVSRAPVHLGQMDPKAGQSAEPEHRVLSTQTRTTARPRGKKAHRGGPSPALLLGMAGMIAVLLVLLAITIRGQRREPGSASPVTAVQAAARTIDPTSPTNESPRPAPSPESPAGAAHPGSAPVARSVTSGGPAPAPATRALTSSPPPIPTVATSATQARTPAPPPEPPAQPTPTPMASPAPGPEPRVAHTPPAPPPALEIDHNPVARAMAGTSKTVVVSVTGPEGTLVTLHHGPEGGGITASPCSSVGSGVYRGNLPIPAAGGVVYWIEVVTPDGRSARSGSPSSPHRVIVF